MRGARVDTLGGVMVALALAAAVLLAAAPLRAADEAGEDAVAAAGRTRGVEVRVDRGPAGLEVEGRCLVRGGGAEAWAVLTDYDGISSFVSSMRASHVSGRGPGYVLVDQVAVGRLFLFSRRMHATLRVVEEPQTRIQFEDVLKRDFTTYVGEWRVEPAEHGTAIVYRVTARPTFSLPDGMVRGMFRKTVRDLLSQVAAEIDRRATGTGAPESAEHTEHAAAAVDVAETER